MIHLRERLLELSGKIQEAKSISDVSSIALELYDIQSQFEGLNQADCETLKEFELFESLCEALKVKALTFKP